MILLCGGNFYTGFRLIHSYQDQQKLEFFNKNVQLSREITCDQLKQNNALSINFIQIRSACRHCVVDTGW